MRVRCKRGCMQCFHLEIVVDNDGAESPNFGDACEFCAKGFYPQKRSNWADRDGSLAPWDEKAC